MLSLLALLLLVITIVVWYLSPSRLTPMVEREVNKMIDGQLRVQKVELTFWSSFPHLMVDVNSLSLTSGVMTEWPKDGFRSDVAPDSLLSVTRIHGGVNLLTLVTGKIKLYDLYIESPRVNIVMGADGLNNYNIFRTQETVDTVPVSEDSGSLPPISIDRFRLVDAGPLTFTSIPDSLFVSLTLRGTTLSSTAAHDGYRLEIDGNANTAILDSLKMSPLMVIVDGHIDWNPERPAAVQVRDMDMKINEFALKASVDVDATDSLTVNSLYLCLDTLNVSAAVAHLPVEMAQTLEGLDTDMKVTMEATLLSPYVVKDSLTVPSMKARLNIEPAYFYMGDIHMDRVELDATATVDGDDLDKSSLHIETFDLKGRALDFAVDGDVTGPVDNPYVDGHIATSLRLDMLPAKLLKLLPAKVSGDIKASTAMRLHAGDFTPARFHNIYLDGNMIVTDLEVATNDTLLNAMAHRIDFDFGTSRTVKGEGYRADSMLTVSIDVDTTSISIPGLDVRGKGLEADLGVLNNSTLADTTKINPFGGIIKIKGLTMDQPADSMSVRLRDVYTKATLSRYQGISRNPHINFDLTARRIGVRGEDYSMVVSQPQVTLNAHIIPTTTNKGNGSRQDKTRRRLSNNRQHSDSTLELIDWNVNNDIKTLLRRWDINGEVKSNRAFIFTRSFPLRQRASDIDLTFSTDSVMLRSLKYSIGHTRMDVTGSISNIERALAGRSNRSKLRIDFDVDAHYIDINELSTTAFTETDAYAGPDPDYDEEVPFMAVTGDSVISRPLLIPSNIDARLAVKADTILYSDLLMYGMRGEVLVNNSAINLRDLKAATEIGTASLSALYWAPDTTRMQFGMGLKLNRFHIDRVLSLIPAVDTLLPALQGFAGVINADLAASSHITPSMDIDMPTFKAALKLDGDSLVLLDADTFKMLSKWLVFKNKKRNMIDSMSVEIAVADNEVQIYPFIFDIDRYRLGVMGHNDMDMNLDYHVSVLKSPLPFKFGINIKGNIDKYKIRFGGAKVKPGTVARYAIADSTRINLLSEIEDVFRRGSMSEGMVGVKDNRNKSVEEVQDEVITPADSALMRQEGFLPPDTTAVAPVAQPDVKKKKNGRK